MKNLIAVAMLTIVGCAGADQAKSGGPADASTRAATQAECPYGGYVLSIEDQDIPVCNGKNGVDGKPGAVGPAGPTGAKGMQGATGPAGPASDTLVITSTEYCAVNVTNGPLLSAELITLSNGQTLISCAAYTGAVSDTSLTASGKQCVLGDTNGVTIFDLSVSPATVSGAYVGTLSCS